MTVVVPDPVPLDMPPGNADALGEVLACVAGAGFHLTVLSRRLGGPAAAAPGWLGHDAAAAATQVGVVATVAGAAVDAVLSAMHRLSDHARRLEEARRRVAALRQEQDDDFAATWTRLSALGDVGFAMRAGAPEAAAVVDELRAGEEARRRRHEALLEEVADDAAATARVLADCCAVVGGGGRRGDVDQVVAFLAARLPGWGDAELAARGRALADDLLHRTTRPETLADVTAAISLATSPAFAAALLGKLRVEGVEGLLTALGYDSFGGSSAVARVLAAALGAAVPGEGGPEEIDAVLTATYVRPGDHSGPSDVVAAGMAALLVAAAPGTRGGLRLDTVADWGRQLLQRERARGVFAGAGAVPRDWDPATFEPAALVIDILARSGEPAPAAALLSDRGMWDALLARGWGDGGTSLGELVVLAAAGSGPQGRAAMRAGLEALGGGLDDGGDPDGWTVNRRTAAAVAGPVAAGLAGHPAVLIELLGAGAAGRPSTEEGDGLRGLGYLTIDRTAAGIVERALLDGLAAHVAALEAPSQAESLRLVGVPAGYLAVQEYGQRLAHALHMFELEREAESKQFLWNVTGHLLTHLPGPVGGVAGVLEPFATRMLGLDGTWEAGPDRGLAFDSADAARSALGRALEDGSAPSLLAVAREARDSFDRTTEALGELDPPEEPVTHWWDPFLEAATSLGLDRAEARRLRGK